jgi:general secretion pathway protein C
VHSLANRLVEPAKILIIIGIAYTLAMTGWYFVSGPTPLALADDKPKAGRIGKPPLSIAEITARNLFGQAHDVAAPAAFDAPETHLRLTLEGVFQAEQPEESAAIVAEQNKPGELFLVGGKLPGNVTLTEVHADRIVLKRNGVLETLRFSDEAPLLTAANRGDAMPSPESSDMSGDDSPQMPEPPPDTSEPPAEAAADPNSSASLGSVVESYRERLQQDPTATLNSLGVAPVSSSGAQGYRLDNIANSPYLAQTGLQPGDVVLSVNGRPVGDVQSDQAEMASIIAQGSARLEVQRGSRRFFVTASLK